MSNLEKILKYSDRKLDPFVISLFPLAYFSFVAFIFCIMKAFFPMLLCITLCIALLGWIFYDDYDHQIIRATMKMRKLKLCIHCSYPKKMLGDDPYCLNPCPECGKPNRENS